MYAGKEHKQVASRVIREPNGYVQRFRIINHRGKIIQRMNFFVDNSMFSNNTIQRKSINGIKPKFEYNHLVSSNDLTDDKAISKCNSRYTATKGTEEVIYKNTIICNDNFIDKIKNSSFTGNLFTSNGCFDIKTAQWKPDGVSIVAEESGSKRIQVSVNNENIVEHYKGCLNPFPASTESSPNKNNTKKVEIFSDIKVGKTWGTKPSSTSNTSKISEKPK